MTENTCQHTFGHEFKPGSAPCGVREEFRDEYDSDRDKEVMWTGVSGLRMKVTTGNTIAVLHDVTERHKQAPYSRDVTKQVGEFRLRKGDPHPSLPDDSQDARALIIALARALDWRVVETPKGIVVIEDETERDLRYEIARRDKHIEQVREML